MFPKTQRLPRTALSTRPLEQVRFRFGTIKTVGEPGFAVVVSKKTAKTAPLRNRMRRRVYALLRKIVTTPLTRGIIVFPLGEVARVPHNELEIELSRALQPFLKAK